MVSFEPKECPMKKSWFLNLIKNSANEKNIKETPDTEHICLSDISAAFSELTENSREQSNAVKTALNNIRESVSRLKKTSEEVLYRIEAIDLGVTNQ